MFKRVQAVALAAALALSGCGIFGGNPDQPLPINKAAVAAQSSAGILFNTGAVLVKTCVLKTDSTTYAQVSASFAGLAQTYDTLATDVANGVGDTAALFDTGRAALTAVQAIIAGLQPSPEQSKAIHLETPKQLVGPKGKNFSEIVGLVQQYLPVVLSAGPDIIGLVRGFIDNLKVDDKDVGKEAVASANTAMHTGLDNWTQARCIQ